MLKSQKLQFQNNWLRVFSKSNESAVSRVFVYNRSTAISTRIYYNLMAGIRKLPGRQRKPAPIFSTSNNDHLSLSENAQFNCPVGIGGCMPLCIPARRGQRGMEVI